MQMTNINLYTRKKIKIVLQTFLLHGYYIMHFIINYTFAQRIQMLC